MIYAIGKYRVEILTEEIFVEGSIDNVCNYEIVYFKDIKYKSTTTIGIKVFEDHHLKRSAVIGSVGGGTRVSDSSIVLEGDKILICCADSVFCLSIPDLELLWQTKADAATCFEIFKYQDSYIVHGELEISRLDNTGGITWQYGGADIFVPLNGEGNFQLTEDHIIATDFQNRIYKIDYDGIDHTDMS